MPLIAKIGYVKERREWVALIHEEGKRDTVCVGCEFTRAAAERFARDALAFHEGLTDQHPHDIYDRLECTSRH